MQSVSSQMFSEKSLASNSSYGVVKGTEKFPVTDGLLEVPKPTGTNVGGVLAPYGYHIDEDGRLQSYPIQDIEYIIVGYNITTEEPTEGWYNGEELIEQDLSDTTFTPVEGTFYKHTGTSTYSDIYPAYIYTNNGIHYWNGTRYISYFYTNGKENVYKSYTMLSEQVTWESGKYYSFSPEYITSIQRNTCPDGTPYNFDNMVIMIRGTNNYSTQGLGYTTYCMNSDYSNKLHEGLVRIGRQIGQYDSPSYCFAFHINGSYFLPFTDYDRQNDFLRSLGQNAGAHPYTGPIKAWMWYATWTTFKIYPLTRILISASKAE